MDINGAVEAIDRFLQGYTGPGDRRVTEQRVRPSGDDLDTIKIWVSLGAAAEGDDLPAWCAACEAAIRAALGTDLDPYRLELRADAL